MTRKFNRSSERAVFGANCFWGAEATFQHLAGVLDTAVGFMGDSLSDGQEPTSDQDAKSKHQVEVVNIEFDPQIISYRKLLDTFWSSHNPSLPVYLHGDRHPSGERSVIFTSCPEQFLAARESLANASCSGRFKTPLTTTIEPTTHFHSADEKHQCYFERNERSRCAMKQTKTQDS